MIVFAPFVQERAADDSKEVEGFQQLLLARTQVNITEELWENIFIKIENYLVFSCYSQKVVSVVTF